MHRWGFNLGIHDKCVPSKQKILQLTDFHVKQLSLKAHCALHFISFYTECCSPKEYL